MDTQNKTKRYKVLIFLIVVIVFGFVLLQKKSEAPVVDTPDPQTPVQSVIVKGKAKVEDLVDSSIKAGDKVSGEQTYSGTIQGGYFFEGNILINVMDSNQQILKSGHGTATTDWMTSGPVTFSTDVDFTNLSAGPAYLELHNDNASGEPANDKSILIPIIIQ